jgi:hypothetical protein
MTPIARRAAALAATLIVAASLLAVQPRAVLAADPTFTDIGASPFQTEIEFLVDAGITQGCNPPANTMYCPTDPVRRDQMASFLGRGLYLAPASENYFDDDEGSPHEADINRIRQAGITQGCNPPTNDLYCPALSVRRDQMASFIARALALPDPVDDYFTDDEGSVHEADINKMFEAEITFGCNPPDNDLYCPDQPVTREQMAAFLYRALTVDLEPLPETFGTVAEAVHYLLWDVDLELPASCGGDPTVNCPDGSPISPGPQLSLDGTQKTVTASGGAYTFAVTISVVSIQDIPVSAFGLDCNLEVDTAPGLSPTIDVSGTIDFGPYDPDGPGTTWLPSTELNRLVVESVAVTGVEETDLSLTGPFQCQLAGFAVGVFVDMLTSALEDYVADAAPCGPAGPELFIKCPTVPFVGV